MIDLESDTLFFTVKAFNSVASRLLKILQLLEEVLDDPDIAPSMRAGLRARIQAALADVPGEFDD